MDLSGHESEIPLPISSTYGGHGHHHSSIIPDSPPSTTLHHSNGPHQVLEDQEHQHHNQQQQYNIVPYNPKKGSGVVVKYRECLKNHAAAIGGNATDGCGEFMPSGDEGTLEALKCSACGCHRNFHRKEIEGEGTHDLNHPSNCDCFYHHMKNSVVRRPNNKGVLVSGTAAEGYGVYPRTTAAAVGAPLQAAGAGAHHGHGHMVMPLGAVQASESDEMEGVVRAPVVKKRFRTKFTAEQKEKMLGFAERAGWRLQRQEESVVQQFCQEIGVKRRVLKVWMHNNKHNFAKKSSPQLQPE